MGATTATVDRSGQALAWAKGHLASGVDPEKLVEGLMKQGWPEYDARMVLDTAMTSAEPAPAAAPVKPQRVVSYARPAKPVAQQYKTDNSRHVNRMIIGGVMLGVGLAITIGTFTMASNSPGGGTYFLCWGPIIFGGIRLVTGFFGWVGNR